MPFLCVRLRLPSSLHWMILGLVLGAIPVSAQTPPQPPSELQQLIDELDELGFEFTSPDSSGNLPLDQYGKPIYRKLVRPVENQPDHPADNRRATPIEQITGIQIEQADDAEEKLDAQHVDRITRWMPHLRALKIDHARASRLFAARLADLRSLEHLHIAFGRGRNFGSEIPEAAAQLTKLRTLDLWDGLLTDDLVAGFEQLSEMRRLTLAPLSASIDGRPDGPSKDTIRAETLSRVLVAMPELEYLDMARCPLPGKFDWAGIAKLPKLQEIHFRWSGIDDEQIVGIDALDQVKHLELTYAPITGDSLSEIAGMKQLRYLGIHHTQVHSGILQLQRAANLQSVGVSSTICRDERLDDQRLALLARWKVGFIDVDGQDNDLLSLDHLNEHLGDIKRIELRASSTMLHYVPRDRETGHPREKRFGLNRVLTERDFKSMGRLPKLETLELSARSQITSKETSGLRDSPSLQTITIANARLDRQFIDDLVSIPNWKRLIVENAVIGERAFASLAKAKALEQIKVAAGEMESNAADRLTGLAQAPSLKELKLCIGTLNDSDSRQIASSQTLQTLELAGSFSPRGLATFSQTPRLQNLALHGLQVTDVLRDFRHLRNPMLKYVRFNATATPIHFGTIYSQVTAMELGATMAGECSCTCMDESAPQASVIPDRLVNIRGDRMTIHAESLQEFLQSTESHRGDYGTPPGLRITAPIRRNKLVVDLSSIPIAKCPLYLSNCYVDQLELIDDGRPVGVFGQVGEVLVRDDPANPRERTELTLSGVQRVVVHSAAKLVGAGIQGDVTTVRFEGDFPELLEIPLRSAPHLKYFAAPYRGTAPKLTITGGLDRLHDFKKLRLLKLPGTGLTDKSWFSSYYDQRREPTPPLHEVDMRHTAISDRVLDDLGRIKSLRILKLEGCRNVTPKGIAAIKKQIPQLTVVLGND